MASCSVTTHAGGGQNFSLKLSADAMQSSGFSRNGATVRRVELDLDDLDFTMLGNIELTPNGYVACSANNAHPVAPRLKQWDFERVSEHFRVHPRDFLLNEADEIFF